MKQTIQIAPKLMLLLLLLVTALNSAACGGGKLFNIATRIDLPPEQFPAQTVVENILVAASPLVDEDQIIATFDGNTILAGILPVRVLIENRSSEPLDLRHAQFMLTNSQGHRFDQVDSRTALKRLVAFYGIRVQQQGAFKKTLADFSDLALPQQGALNATERREGFIFFRIPTDQSVPTGLKLAVKHLRLAQAKRDLVIELAIQPS